MANTILFVAANGCKWRALPGYHGCWHSIYTRMSRAARASVLNAVFERLQRERLMRARIKAVSLDSTIMKAHPDGTGTPKKTVPRPSARVGAAGPPSFLWLPQMPATL